MLRKRTALIAATTSLAMMAPAVAPDASLAKAKKKSSKKAPKKGQFCSPKTKAPKGSKLKCKKVKGKYRWQ